MCENCNGQFENILDTIKKWKNVSQQIWKCFVFLCEIISGILLPRYPYGSCRFSFFLSDGICVQKLATKVTFNFHFSKLSNAEIRDRARNLTHVYASLLWFCFRLARNCSFVLQWLLLTIYYVGKSLRPWCISYRRLLIGNPIFRRLDNGTENTQQQF